VTRRGGGPAARRGRRANASALIGWLGERDRQWQAGITTTTLDP
jgi:hypothetical protein